MRRRIWWLISSLSTAHWLWTVGSGLIAPVVGASLRLSWPWLVMGGVGVACLVGSVIVGYRHRTLPWIRFAWIGTTSFQVPKFETYIPAGGGSPRQRTRRFVMQSADVGVSNDPPGRSSTAVLSDAVIRLAYYKVGEQRPSVEAEGAWGQPPQTTERIDILPNGQIVRFAVALKHTGETDTYAASRDLWTSRDVRMPSQKLRQEFRVKVTISGVGLPKTRGAWFLVTNPETQAPLQIQLDPE
jgi:hypothetical protein